MKNCSSGGQYNINIYIKLWSLRGHFLMKKVVYGGDTYKYI